MTVTQQDAQDFNVPVEVLAQQWATQLNQAFDEPPLAIDVGQRLYCLDRGHFGFSRAELCGLVQE